MEENPRKQNTYFYLDPSGKRKYLQEETDENLAKIVFELPKIGSGLTVERSNIFQAGKGLFATRDYKKNEIITYYDGIAVDELAFFKIKMDLANPLLNHLTRTSEGVPHMLVGSVIRHPNDGNRLLFLDTDAIDVTAGPLGNGPFALGGASFANSVKKNKRNAKFVSFVDAKEFEKEKEAFKSYSTVEYLPDSKIKTIVATRDIKDGEEIYLSYSIIARPARNDRVPTQIDLEKLRKIIVRYDDWWVPKPEKKEALAEPEKSSGKLKRKILPEASTEEIERKNRPMEMRDAKKRNVLKIKQ